MTDKAARVKEFKRLSLIAHPDKNTACPQQAATVMSELTAKCHQNAIDAAAAKAAQPPGAQTTAQKMGAHAQKTKEGAKKLAGKVKKLFTGPERPDSHKIPNTNMYSFGVIFPAGTKVVTKSGKFGMGTEDYFASLQGKMYQTPLAILTPPLAQDTAAAAAQPAAADPTSASTPAAAAQPAAADPTSASTPAAATGQTAGRRKAKSKRPKSKRRSKRKSPNKRSSKKKH
jgi:hypothetical protein